LSKAEPIFEIASLFERPETAIKKYLLSPHQFCVWSSSSRFCLEKDEGFHSILDHIFPVSTANLKLMKT